MSLIRKPNELVINPRIKALIYGAAGIGKTTLALSAKNPLLIDFDGGAQRVHYEFMRDCVQVEHYGQFLQVLNNEDLSAYDTLIIDTGGKMLDSLAEYLIKNNPRLGRSNGMLTQQGYGQRKAEFSAVCKLINSKGKNVIFVAHRQTQNDGDEVRYVPLFGGSNYDALVTELDLVGYVEADGRKRLLTFDATSKNDGKNTCNLPPRLIIDELTNENGKRVQGVINDYWERVVMAKFRERLEERDKENKAFAAVMESLRDEINGISDANSANEFIAKINEFNHVGNSKALAARLLSDRARALGLEYDKTNKTYK